jgi:hypothetical protein
MLVGVMMGSTIPNSNERIHSEEKKKCKGWSATRCLDHKPTNKPNLNQPNN